MKLAKLEFTLKNHQNSKDNLLAKHSELDNTSKVNKVASEKYNLFRKKLYLVR